MSLHQTVREGWTTPYTQMQWQVYLCTMHTTRPVCVIWMLIRMHHKNGYTRQKSCTGNTTILAGFIPSIMDMFLTHMVSMMMRCMPRAGFLQCVMVPWDVCPVAFSGVCTSLGIAKLSFKNHSKCPSSRSPLSMIQQQNSYLACAIFFSVRQVVTNNDNVGPMLPLYQVRPQPKHRKRKSIQSK